MKDLPDLVAQFVNEIRHSSGGMESRISGSEAGRELRAKSTKTTIRAIGAYLEKQPTADLNTVEGDIHIALAMLLSRIGTQLNLFIPQELVFGDRAGWIAWAKRVDT